MLWKNRLNLMVTVVGFLTFCLLIAPVPVQADDAADEAAWTEEESDNDTSHQPSFESSIRLKQSYRQINGNSRLNPDNRLLTLDETPSSMEVKLGLSDTIDESNGWRWLINTTGSSLFEKSAVKDQSSDQLRLDELFIDRTIGDWFISLGKRRNNWGPALAFNPVNVVVPPRDPLNPEDQSEGQPMLWLNYADDRVMLDLIYTMDYDRNWDGNLQRWGSRLSFLAGESEFGVYLFDGEKSEDGTDFNQMTGFSYSGNFMADATLYIEAARFSSTHRNYYTESGTTETKDETAIKTAAGSLITLDGNTSLMIEAFWNSSGYTRAERENYFAAVDSALNPYPDPAQLGVFDDFQFTGMNQTYLLVSYRKSEIWEKYAFSIQALAAEDRSSTSELQGEYNINDFYKMTLLIKNSNGSENSEFGNGLFSSEIELAISAAY